MLKTGIITHYYNSKNYGGNLQAYALCYKLNTYHFMQVEQISFKFNEKISIKKHFSKRICKFLKSPIKSISKIWKCVISNLFKKKKNVVNRARAFKEFNNSIPHSSEIYGIGDLADSYVDYDILIAGSDQVWNGYLSEFFLEFGTLDVKRISYAASMSGNKLPKDLKGRFSQILLNFSAVSVREQRAVELLKDISPVEPILVVDPVFLLSKNEWLDVASTRKPAEKYICCYFLGITKAGRKLAEEYAKQNGYKIATFPFIADYTKLDKTFGDYKFYDATPNDFLSLIANAEAVFTDSFHAVAFSTIFQKQFFVFNRNKKGSMNSRIYNICDLFDVQERFCDSKDKECMEYINSLQDIDYTQEFPKFNAVYKQSIDFIEKNIVGQENIIEEGNIE